MSYAKKLACYGGSSLSDAQSVSTCSEQAVVLDTKQLYSVYAAICVVGFLVLLLMMGILIIHRKYRNVSRLAPLLVIEKVMLTSVCRHTTIICT